MIQKILTVYRQRGLLSLILVIVNFFLIRLFGFKIINLGSENTLFNQFVAEIRDVSIQGDSMRFRRNCERLGEIFAYEVSKTLTYKQQEVITPLGVAEMKLLIDEQVTTRL